MIQSFFYKERDLKQEKNSMAFNIPKDVEKDYIKHFKSLKPDLINKKTGKLNNNQILLNLVVDYLNMQCLERREFNIEILITIDKNKEDKIIPLAIRENSKYEHRNMKEYFTPVEFIPNSEELFSTYIKGTYFNRYIDPEWINYEYKYDNCEFYIFLLNNVLDEFKYGQYQIAYDYDKDENNILKSRKILVSTQWNSNINQHSGLTILNKKEILYYTWEYSSYSHYFNIDFMRINQEEVEVMINNSSNQKLKNYYEKNYKKIIKEENNENNCNNEVPTDYESENKKLKEKIRKLEKENKKLKHKK